MSSALKIAAHDIRGPKATRSLNSRGSELASPREQLRVLETVDLPGLDVERTLQTAALQRTAVEIFQINVGKVCNMTCRHCHVDAGPDRTDSMMSRETADACLRALDATTAHTVDITGGAPELNPSFRYLIEQARDRGKHVMDRCNLTILLTPKMSDMPEWLAERGVEIVASLPHVSAFNTDAQRGNGTFDDSIEALRRLNAAGYGQGDPERVLTLVANPAGAFLNGDQCSMQREWKATLERRFGVTFDRLFALNNMPIARFLEWLIESGNLEGYMERLANAFNPAAVEGLMCRNTISVSWEGYVYDCDFNQMLDLKLGRDGAALRIEDFDPEAFNTHRIRTHRHCLACTAGAGSSCGGATT